MKRAYGPSTERIRASHWRDLVLFHEYFHGDTDRGLDASDQTGWNSLSVKLLEHAHKIAYQSSHELKTWIRDAMNFRIVIPGFIS
jgi:acetylornithine/succinyldiaminopimelate/putrescine aminotransferase